MSRRGIVLGGMAAGLVWAVAVVIWALRGGWNGALTAPAGLTLAAFCNGIVLMALIARLAQRRFFDDALIDGQPFAGGASVDQRVLTNSVEQVALAACIWPAVAMLWGGGAVALLGLALALTRVAFWLGYHLSPPLRGFGFAGGFYATILAAAAVLWRMA